MCVVNKWTVHLGDVTGGNKAILGRENLFTHIVFNFLTYIQFSKILCRSIIGIYIAIYFFQISCPFNKFSWRRQYMQKLNKMSYWQEALLTFDKWNLCATTDTSKMINNHYIIVKQQTNVNSTHKTDFPDNIFTLNFKVRTKNKESN